ncbi:MAG TPA: secretin N-terminal domain-containing protein [Burkholderiales bacterium]|nr:secretin N-terminal domain-containing protein [Burkholderiales bacterium]
MTNARIGLVVGALLLASCGTPPPPKSVDGQILGELQAAGERKAVPPPSAVDQALLPPLRMEMPSVAGRPLEPRFDLSVNSAPAAQVFMSLVSGTRYSMLLHQGVTGTISVSLKDVTLQEALESIRDLYGYEFRFDGSRISVQPAGMQTRVFRVNYLTGQRRGTSDVRVQSGSVADIGSTGAPTPTSASQPLPGAASGNLPVARSIDSSRISTQQTNDFWAELRLALQAIVGTAEGRSVVVTPHSGVIVVRALPSEIRGVEHYLRETRLSVERQVMLEAKIIEVTLADAYQAGINWAVFRTGSTNAAIGQFNPGQTGAQLGTSGALSGGGVTANAAARAAGVASTTASAANSASAVFGLALQTSNFAALLTFLESQGTVQVLSSPRVATLNNQKAVLKVGTDEFFVTNVSTVTTTTGTTTQQTPTVTVAPFFSGILLDVTPRIDEDNNIMLHIHPSISEVTESQRVVNLGGTIPSITLPLARSTVSETDTIVRATDGNIVAIGGLMSVDVRDNRGGIPGGPDALRNTDRQTRKRELVILLKPTVLADDRGWEQDVRDTEQRIRNMYPSGGEPRR